MTLNPSTGHDNTNSSLRRLPEKLLYARSTGREKRLAGRPEKKPKCIYRKRGIRPSQTDGRIKAQAKTLKWSIYGSPHSTALGRPLNEIPSELEPFRVWVERLPGVTKAPHRFGGVEFQVHGLEFMHFHGDTHLDIHLSKEDQTKVLGERKAERHRFAPEAGWVTIRIHSDRDLKNATEVVQLAYTRAKRIMETHLARRKASNITS